VRPVAQASVIVDLMVCPPNITARSALLWAVAEYDRLVPRPPEMVPLVSKRFPCGFPIEPPIDLGSCFVNTAVPCRGFFA